MAYRGAPAQFPQGFRQDITYEQILKEQVRVCLDMFNEGDRDGMQRAIDALCAMITPRMADSEFREDIDKLDEEWKATVKSRETERRKQVDAARNGAPDLIPAVSQKPSLAHLGRVLYTVLSLLERKKMALKLEVEESV